MIKSMQIIPALITEDDNSENDLDELKVKFEKIRPYLGDFQNWVQIDVTDGQFVPAKTNIEIPEFGYFTDLASIDFHLMIKNPEDVMEEWLDNKPKRITIHLEATDKILEIIKKCRESEVEIGLALNPETPNSMIEPWFSDIDLLLYLGVHPGRGGQKFIPEVMEKIRSLPHRPPHVKIGLDGGVNEEVVRLAREAGVDLIVVGSAIFKSQNIGDALNVLIKDAR